MRFFVAAGTGATGSSGTQIVDSNTLTFTTNTPGAIKLSVATGVSGAVINIDSTGAGTGGTGVAGATGAPAQLIWAQYQIMANSAGTHVDAPNFINFNSTIADAADGSIVRTNGGSSSQMSSKNIQITKSGNYLVSFTVATNGTGAIPDIAYEVTDANGTRTIPFLNVMPAGGTSGTVTVPITVNNSSSPATLGLKVVNAANMPPTPSWISLPGAQPQGALSIVKIS
jgi:hypothetical protein